MVTLLHALELPLAYLCGYAAGAIARRRKIRSFRAYLVALAPGILIALAFALFGPDNAPDNERPWQGLVIWASWAGVGILSRIRLHRKETLTRLHLTDRSAL